MIDDKDFEFETFEEYFGDTHQVDKIINECDVCRTKLAFTHQSNYQELIIKEARICPRCGHRHIKSVHVIN